MFSRLSNSSSKRALSRKLKPSSSVFAPRRLSTTATFTPLPDISELVCSIRLYSPRRTPFTVIVLSMHGLRQTASIIFSVSPFRSVYARRNQAFFCRYSALAFFLPHFSYFFGCAGTYIICAPQTKPAVYANIAAADSAVSSAPRAGFLSAKRPSSICTGISAAKYLTPLNSHEGAAATTM